MGRANLRNTMHDCPLSTEYGEGQLKKTPCTIRPLTTALTDGCTLNPLVQAESTLFRYFAANTKKAIFSLFKYTLRYIDVQEGGAPAGRGDSNKSRPLRFLPPLRYSSSSKYGVRKQIWIQKWFMISTIRNKALMQCFKFYSSLDPCLTSSFWYSVSFPL